MFVWLRAHCCLNENCAARAVQESMTPAHPVQEHKLHLKPGIFALFSWLVVALLKPCPIVLLVIAPVVITWLVLPFEPGGGIESPFPPPQFPLPSPPPLAAVSLVMSLLTCWSLAFGTASKVTTCSSLALLVTIVSCMHLLLAVYTKLMLSRHTRNFLPSSIFLLSRLLARAALLKHAFWAGCFRILNVYFVFVKNCVVPGVAELACAYKQVKDNTVDHVERV